MPPSTLPPLFRLPLELRQHIYSYLLPLGETVSHPLPAVGITSVTPRPPAAALLNIHPRLTHELLAYFYARATWKLVFAHAFNFFRVDPDLRRLAASPALPRLRRVELVFFCDALLLRAYPSFGVASLVEEIRRRAERACDVLRTGARRLREVVVSWIDTTETGAWEEKKAILEPLRKLATQEDRAGKGSPITFRVGEVSGPDGVDKESFAKAMREVLGTAKILETSCDGAADDDPIKLRMLAFDTRQDRHKIYGRGYMPGSGQGRSGWRAAPAELATAIEEDC